MTRCIWFFCFLSSVISGCAGECTGKLDDEQVEFITYSASADQMNQRQEKLLVLGIIDSTIKKLQKKFPQLDVVPLDNPIQAPSLPGKQTDWEDQYDKILIYLALEKDPHREEKLRVMYKALKSGKDGIIICIRNDALSIDRWVSQFAETAELTPFISSTPNLSLEDYRALIQDVGFCITNEYPSVSILTNVYAVTEWICRRWAIPLSMQSLFMVGFPRFMEGVLSGHEIIYSGLHVFRIRK